MSNGQQPLRVPADQAKEMPMVDLAFLVLKEANTPFYYRDLMAEVAKYKGFSDEDIRSVIAQLYTEINVDGRFACVGNNLWGLKRWYPVDNKTDDGVGGKRPRIINDEDDDLDEEDVFHEEEYNTDDDFESFDEEQDEEAAEVEEEEEEEFFPEEELEEEDLGDGEENAEEESSDDDFGDDDSDDEDSDEDDSDK